MDCKLRRLNALRAGQASRVFTIGSILALWIVLLLPISLFAQIATGRLTGTVKDSSGAVVVGATITLTNNGTGVVSTVPSTSTGTYVFEAVNPGTYKLQAVSVGFKSFTSEGVVIHLQQDATVDISLEPGATSERVTVTAAAPLLQAEDASLGQTIDTRTINDMPLAGRNWASLAQLSAGVNTTAGGNTSSAYFTVNGINYHQNDFRLNGIDDNVEIYADSQIGTNAAITPPPDAIEEFKLQNADYSAEFGHSTSGVINAVVKSGGNAVHGDVWEYIRNEAFDANDYFSNQNHKPRAEYRENQFGGTVGGPVYIPKLYNGKDKSFFFFDYQGTRIIQPSNVTSTVPTMAMANSGFSNLQDLITYNAGTRSDALARTFPLATVFDPSTTRTVAGHAIDPVSGLLNPSASTITVRDPFYTGGSVAGITNFTTHASQLNIIPGSRIDPNAVKLLQLYPAQTSPGFSNNYFHSARSTNNINQIDARFDQNIGHKDVIFAVYSWAHFITFQPGALPGYADGQQSSNGTKDSPHYAIAGGYTHIFTPTLTNDFHIGYIHNIDNAIPLNADVSGIPEQFGIQGIPQLPGNGGLSAINLTGLSSLGVASYSPTIRTITSLQLSDNVTKVHGSQTFKAGFEVIYIDAPIIQSPYAKGFFNYSGQYSSIPNASSGLTGLADALLVPTLSSVGATNNVGGVTSFQGSNFSNVDDHRDYTGVYFEDDWKVTPSLTLNLGIRWDLTTPYLERNGRQANFIAANGNGPTANYYLPNKTCNNPRSTSFNTLAAKDGIAITCIPGLRLGDAQYTNFAPRVGFAYRIKPTLVVRGGYGLAYGNLDSIGFGGTLGQNYPFLYTVIVNSANTATPITLPNGQTATMETSLANTNLQDATQLNPATGIALSGRQFNFIMPYTETTNLTVQYQFTNFDSIQIGYVGTFGHHLDSPSTSNSASSVVAPGASIFNFIPFPDFAPNSEVESTKASSNYTALQVVYARQMHYGLSALANYTYSKCLTNQLVFGGTLPLYRAEWLPGAGIRQDYQICPTDVRQVTHISGTYELPVGRGRQFMSGGNRWAQAFLGGWAVNGIFTHETGQPFTIKCPVATSAFFGCNANVLPGANVYAGPHNQKQWLNPAAFANPAIATTGQSSLAFLGGQAGQVRGPSLSNFDSSVFKDFPIVEQIRLQFRVEAFNTLNTPQFSSPSSQLNFTNTTNFSTITALRGPARLLQFALKLYF
jgi:hypothetical protein